MRRQLGLKVNRAGVVEPASRCSTSHCHTNPPRWATRLNTAQRLQLSFQFVQRRPVPAESPRCTSVWHCERFQNISLHFFFKPFARSTRVTRDAPQIATPKLLLACDLICQMICFIRLLHWHVVWGLIHVFFSMGKKIFPIFMAPSW